MANKYENAENIGKLLSGGALSELNKKVGAVSYTHLTLPTKLEV